MNRSAVAKGDVISGLALATLGAYVVLEARRWVFLDEAGPGPGFFPTCYGIGMIAASLALVVHRLSPSGRGDAVPVDWPGVVNALSTWFAFVMVIPAMTFVGFPIAFGLLILFFLKFVFPRSTRFALIAAVLTPIGFMVVFPLLLGVQLPVGRWTGF